MNKAFVVTEIQRTTAANGGIPLGLKRFLTETGLKESDFIGRYWARWSEALQEAGFAANQLQQRASRDDLLSKYASLARQLGRLPTHGDLVLRSNTNPEFPSTKPFRRLGSKSELVQQLAAYCRDHAGNEDVARLCRDYVPPIQTEQAAKDVIEGELGFVYLLKHGTRREYRIGCTTNVLRREGEIAIELPEKIQPIHVITTDDPFGIEAYWHRRFHAKRMNGDWFKLDSADISAFRRRKFM